MNMGSLFRWLLTLAVIAVACVFCYIRYNAYFRNPWTRDGMVQAEVVQVASRVSAPIRTVHVVDNAFVKAGQPLFDLDDSLTRLAVERAEADLAQKQALARTARDRASRDTRLQRAAPGALSAEAYRQAQDELLSAEADVEVAKAALNQARLDQAFTQVVAPVDGYVVNLTLQPGTMAVAYQPLLALISSDSFRIEAFFRETQIGHFRPGDKALVTLMGYPGLPLNATVESIGWGIARQNGSTGEDLLPVVSPTFEWIRLAQRIPVRVRLDELPQGVNLRMGTTASVLVRVDPRDKRGDIAPLPTLAQ